MEELPVWLPLAFFTVALLYSSVGFGGGSSYLALMVLAGFPYEGIPATALVCNTIVAAGGVLYFGRAGHLKGKLMLPFLLLSMPMAYLGGRMTLSREVFCALLGGSLMVAALRVWIAVPRSDDAPDVSWKRALALGVPMGGALGFLAGLVGIGGGIFLSPALLLLRWANAKEAAAAAALFILLNSLAGLGGQMHKGGVELIGMAPLAAAVFLGGQLGSRLGACHLPRAVIQRGLAGLAFYVSIRLMWAAV